MKKAQEKNLDIIIEIIEDGKLALKNDGVDQWQKGQPSIKEVREDIMKNEGYIYECDGEIAAYVFLKSEYENNYKPIEDEFENHNDFFTIHRFVVSNKYKRKGIAKKFFDDIKTFAMANNKKAIRIDTHKDNFKMRSFIDGCGFREVGLCFVDDGDRRSERIAYELIL